MFLVDLGTPISPKRGPSTFSFHVTVLYALNIRQILTLI